MRLEEVWRSANPVAAAHVAHCERWVREEGCRRAGALRFDVVITSDGEVTEVLVDREIPTVGPGAIRRVLGETTRIVQVERWSPPGADGVSRADITVSFPGRPVEMTAAAHIAPTPDGSEERVVGEVRVTVPMVGRVVEPEVVRQIVRSLRIEMETGLQWLAGR